MDRTWQTVHYEEVFTPIEPNTSVHSPAYEVAHVREVPFQQKWLGGTQRYPLT